jgi:predicted DNA binding CopG/RHH family protein
MAVRKPDLEQSILEQEDARARKDATLNMRINSIFLEEIKQAAKAQGFDKYQTWLALVLQDAVNEAMGHDVEKF